MYFILFIETASSVVFDYTYLVNNLRAKPKEEGQVARALI